ncbi:MAG: nucleotidyl transferase AbiEii/AbiGii toxin family protein, partial [Tepidiformaceae bacterium]
PEKIVACFLRYLEHGGLRVSRAEFEENLAAKLADDVFLRDLPPLLGVGISHDPAAAFAQVREVLLSRLPERAPRRGRRR